MQPGSFPGIPVVGSSKQGTHLDTGEPGFGVHVGGAPQAGDAWFGGDSHAGEHEEGTPCVLFRGCAALGRPHCPVPTLGAPRILGGGGRARLVAPTRGDVTGLAPRWPMGVPPPLLAMVLGGADRGQSGRGRDRSSPAPAASVGGVLRRAAVPPAVRRRALHGSAPSPGGVSANRRHGGSPRDFRRRRRRRQWRFRAVRAAQAGKAAAAAAVAVAVQGGWAGLPWGCGDVCISPGGTRSQGRPGWNGGTGLTWK